ncbi:hypothetical protein DFH08DRAFT_802094 [Mycena albidolilacea]|uniref:Uncharacterized protein n=1 Tax=Mycena albidolilacea TaxID=1033008 RepID=A0AAD7EZD4_9AGAR|nr:hypothetical protein DFH08DRAFT_802094 [Mycena albidolilacea]
MCPEVNGSCCAFRVSVSVPHYAAWYTLDVDFPDLMSDFGRTVEDGGWWIFKQQQKRYKEGKHRWTKRDTRLGIAWEVMGSDPFPSETGRRTVETVSVPSVEGISLPVLKTGRNGFVNTSICAITSPHSGSPEDSTHQTSHPPRGIVHPSKTGRRTETGQTDPSVFQIFSSRNGRFFDGRSVLRTVRSPIGTTPTRVAVCALSSRRIRYTKDLWMTGVKARSLYDEKKRKQETEEKWDKGPTVTVTP